MKKEMLINVLQPEECRIAIIEDGVLEELYVERTSHEAYTGNIYKGRIVNIEAAIQAAFVDFSVGRNGFLHISDVEPHYFERRRGEESGPAAPNADASRRDRGRRPPRVDERIPPPPPGFGSILSADDPPSERSRPADREPRRDRDRPDRPERPDRSEKGRRDRSSPRRFGEGLTDDDEPWTPPAYVPPPAPPVEATRPEPAAPPPPRPQRPVWKREDATGFGTGLVETEVEPGRELPSEPEFAEINLPPSRTQRSRGTAHERPLFVPEEVVAEPEETPTPLTGDLADEIEFVGEFDLDAGAERPGEASSSERQRRGRRRGGRGRGGRPAAPGAGAPHGREDEILDDLAIPEPDRSADEVADLREGTRPRGRAAIRSRGGERPSLPERPRDLDSTREIDVPRGERIAPHDRAGEPGYVPRRERFRGPEPAVRGPEIPTPVDWVDDLEEPRRGTPELGAEGTEEEREQNRRRRRRRGRRREPDRPPTARPQAEGVRDREPRERRPAASTERGAVEPRERRPLQPPEPIASGPRDDFDFGDGPELDLDDRVDLPDDEIEDILDEVDERDVDDVIDPELEEEIRREIEEIAELEREMGFRAPAARPRRGDEREPEPADSGRGPRARGMNKPPIQDVFRRGDEALVQVIKESIGTKGPTLSTYISIPGRYLVLMPGLNRVGVSRKIADEGQRRRLRQFMNELNPPKGLGFIVRTAGLERGKQELARDLAYLLRLWKVILRRIRKTKAPAVIYQESDMITRTIRDIFNAEIDTIWIDEKSAFERAQEFLRVVMPRYVNRLKLYEEKEPLFHKYGIEEEISKIQQRHVPLPEGGSIVIDQTEALVAIDVNSGNFRVENDAERTAYEMNLRAAREIARQLRLRDLGGVIVNDFIDMREERHRRGVERALRDAIKRDRARTKILRMSAFGLIEMTRQRIRPSLKRSVFEDCPHCGGAAVVKTVESMSIDVMRLLALAAHRGDVRRVNIALSPPVATYLNNRKRRELAILEDESNLIVHIRPEEGTRAEHLQIDCFDANNAEIRLLPPPPPPTRRGR